MFCNELYDSEFFASIPAAPGAPAEDLQSWYEVVLSCDMALRFRLCTITIIHESHPLRFQHRAKCYWHVAGSEVSGMPVWINRISTQ